MELLPRTVLSSSLMYFFYFLRYTVSHVLLTIGQYFIILLLSIVLSARVPQRVPVERRWPRHAAVPVSGASYCLWLSAHRSASVWCLLLPVAHGTPQCQCMVPPTTCGPRHTAVPVYVASYYLWPTAHRSASVWRLHLPVARGTSLCLASIPASGTRHGSANVSLNVCQYATLTPVMQWRTACACHSSRNLHPMLGASPPPTPRALAMRYVTCILQRMCEVVHVCPIKLFRCIS